MTGISIFALIVGAILVNNVVLAQFLGICPVLGVSKDVKSSVGMSGAVCLQGPASQLFRLF